MEQTINVKLNERNELIALEDIPKGGWIIIDHTTFNRWWFYYDSLAETKTGGEMNETM